jgi:hypothetical protein
MRIKRFRGKALILGSDYSPTQINNTTYKPFKLALWDFSSNLITAQNE